MARGKQSSVAAQEPVSRINTAIGKQIRARRHEIGMTQTELARIVGVSQQQIVKYEKGIGRIPADNLLALSRSLRLEPGSLFRPLDAIDIEVSGFSEGNAMPFIVEAFSDRDTVALVRAFSGIQDKAVRKKVLDLVATLADPSASPKKAGRGGKG